MAVPPPLARDAPDELALGPGAAGPVRSAVGRPAQPATFLFRFERELGRIHLAGGRDRYFGAPFPADGPFAAGAVTAGGEERCVARFAAADDASRPRAEALLHRWATADDWTLRVTPELTPLPPLLDGYAHERVCTHCGLRRNIAALVMPYYGLQAFTPTRCDVCGIGRRLPVRE